MNRTQGTNKHRVFSFGDLLRQVLLAWLAAVTLEFLLLPTSLRSLADTAGIAAVSTGRLLLVTVLLTGVFALVSLFLKTMRMERLLIPTVFALLAGLAVSMNPSVPFTVVCGLILLGCIIYGMRGYNGEKEPTVTLKKEKTVWPILTAALALLFFLFVSVWTVARVMSFSAPTFDFGIFSQMFYNMKESGLPMTTVERDGLLSHFHVHMSPIYYLMLPFYMLFPRPETLQVLQAAVMASAVIPLYKIGKNHGLDGWERILLCALLLVYPAFAGGASYDLHENCFLTPLLLWLFWAVDRGNVLVLALSALLTLLVKEDAAVYVAVIALWLILRSLLRVRKEGWRGVITGALLLAVAIGYFLAVTGYLAKYGDGVMTYRYRNFMYDGSDSLMTVVKAVLLSPMKALFECVDGEKLAFIGLTLLPLLGLPLFTRRYERYVLLIPYLLVNLMSDYQYQHDIFFQYTFGSSAFLFYLTTVNLADLKVKNLKKILLALAVIAGSCMFAVNVVPKATVYPSRCVERWEHYETLREALDEIPEEASVSATTSFTTYLSGREILYDVRHATTEHVLDTEYVVMAPGVESYYKKYEDKNGKNGAANFMKFLEKNGYACITKIENAMVVYKRTEP